VFKRRGVLEGLCKVRENGRWPYEIDGLITDRECGAEQVAGAYNIPTKRIVHQDAETWSGKVASHLRDTQPDAVLLLIVRKLGAAIWRDLGIPCLNLHPSLLPAYPGLRTLERNYADAHAAAAKGEEIRLGATIHLVNEHIDQGPIISQRHFTISDAPTLEHAQHVCYLYKTALVLECVCKYIDGTLPNLQNVSAHWDSIAQYALWTPYEPITDVQMRLAQPWAVEWLHRKVDEGAAKPVRKVLHA